jgi:hypothetical protein
MMITTRLAPIQKTQSTESNSVTSLRLAYQEAILDYSILEQQIKNTLLNQFNLLVQLNTELVAAAEKMSVAFDAWSDELDRLLDVPVKVEPLPTPGLRLIDGCFYDSHGSRTLVRTKLTPSAIARTHTLFIVLAVSSFFYYFDSLHLPTRFCNGIITRRDPRSIAYSLRTVRIFRCDCLCEIL